MKKTAFLSILNFIVLLLVLSGSLFVSCSDSGRKTIHNLRVNALHSPLGIDMATPDFSWQMQSAIIGMKQTNYQVIVATDNKFNTIVWDSGIIDSNQSAGIVYGHTGNAKSLLPETDYYWKVNVTDNSGGNHFATSSFSTGLMNPDITAWDGAQWIGSKELALDAATAQLFHIHTQYKILEGNKLSLIFGANDYRFGNKFQNVELLDGENYYRFELDVTGVGTPIGAVLNLYRIGYDKKDSSSVPFHVISRATQPSTNINALITPANALQQNTLDINVSASSMTVQINDSPLLSNSTNPRSGSIALSPSGRSGGDYNVYPNLNSIGFATNPGEKVEFTNYALKNVGQGRDATLFDASTGSTYAVFNAISGVHISGNTITVDSGTFGYADPSHYASLSMLRTEFGTDAGKKIQKANMYITAMGTYEMYINGKRMTDDWFNPGVSQYRETLTYHTYDVTSLLKNGQNALGAILGPGFYTGYMSFTPGNYNFFGDNEALLAKLVITYTDGSKKTIVTNTEDWKLFKSGPIEHASMFHGQRYNANKEAAIQGWSSSGYTDSDWKRPEVIQQRDWIDFDLLARRDNPVREIERLTATRVLQTHSEDKITYT